MVFWLVAKKSKKSKSKKSIFQFFEDLEGGVDYV
jgi:hypothetical protein